MLQIRDNKTAPPQLPRTRTCGTTPCSQSEDTLIMKDQILERMKSMAERGPEPAAEWLTAYEPPAESDLHQFVLFLKPEISTATPGIDHAGVLQVVFDALAEWSVDIGAVRLLNGPYLRDHRIMDRHYGVLNQISKEGRAAISPAAEENLNGSFGDALANGAEVYGAHQFLDAYPAFSAMALSVLSDNVGSTKLAGGTYALPLNILGKDVIVLNAFHPYQLQPFYADDNVLVVLECRSAKGWGDLRRKLAGATNPQKAEEGSIRNRFLKHQEALRLPDVSPGANGIHLSAGPLEGLVELQRFLDDPDNGASLDVDDFAFGALMLDRGISKERLRELAENPVLTAGGETDPAFDLTEEVDAGPAADLLAGA